jgi:DNA-binding LytR/AlgR family response regulator
VAQAISRVRPRTDPMQKEWLRIPVRRRTGTRLLNPCEVDALVAELGDCVAWTAEGHLPVDGSLGYWGVRLAEHGFIRVHRNALVRLAAVRELTTDDELVLGSGRLAISRRRMEEVRRALGLG